MEALAPPHSCSVSICGASLFIPFFPFFDSQLNYTTRLLAVKQIRALDVQPRSQGSIIRLWETAAENHSQVTVPLCTTWDVWGVRSIGCTAATGWLASRDKELCWRWEHAASKGLSHTPRCWACGARDCFILQTVSKMVRASSSFTSLGTKAQLK